MIGSFSLDMIRKKHAWQIVVVLWKIESRHVLPVYDLTKYWLYCSVTLKMPFYIRRNEPTFYVIFKRRGREKWEGAFYFLPKFRSWGPFLESPGNFSGPKSNIQIEI